MTSFSAIMILSSPAHAYTPPPDAVIADSFAGYNPYYAQIQFDVSSDGNDLFVSPSLFSSDGGRTFQPITTPFQASVLAPDGSLLGVLYRPEADGSTCLYLARYTLPAAQLSDIKRVSCGTES